MRLFIGNRGLQKRIFSFRNPMDPKSTLIHQLIEPGEIYDVGDFSKADIDNILGQQRATSLLPYKEAMKSDRAYGLVYAVDKMFKVDDLRHGMERSHELLKEKGIKNRQEYAEHGLGGFVAANDKVDVDEVAPEFRITAMGVDGVDSTITKRERYGAGDSTIRR